MRSLIDTSLLDALQAPGGFAPVGQVGAIPNTPAQPFVWGQGGAQLSPEQLANERSIAESLAQSDYSPVQHWTQGLGRVLDNYDGARRLKKLDGQEAQMSADRLAQIGGLAGEANADLAPGLASADPVVQALAAQMMAARTPKQRAPLEFQQMLSDAGYTPGTPEYQAQAQRLLDAKNNPFITASLPGGNFYAGPQSGFAAALTGGGGPASGAGGRMPPTPSNVPSGNPLSGWPPPDAIQELVANPGSARQFDEVFGQGMASKILGR